MTEPAIQSNGHYDDEPDGRYIVFLDEPSHTPDDFYRLFGPGPPVTETGELSVEEDAPVVAAAIDATTGEIHTGAMIALIPSVEDAERLVLDGGEPLDQLHTTLVYLGEAANISSESRLQLLDAVGKWAAVQPAILMNVFSVNFFNPHGDEPCVVLGLGGDDIETFNDEAVEIAEDADIDTSLSKRPWIPHITLMYFMDEDAVETLEGYNVAGLARQRMGEVLFDRLRVSFGGEIHDFTLQNLG